MTDGSEQNDKTQTHIVLTKGTMVGHYRIIEKIGAGGMGEVYLAQDTELNRNVALKFLPADLCQDDDCRARFKREAQAAAKLDHPNIVTIHEVSEYRGRPFFAMQLVEGQSLRELSKGREISVDRVIKLAIQICDGLGAAHEQKVIHRDIKPSNIVIDAYGRPKILDFGLAAIQGGEHLTKTGSTLGTVRYMSPEQAQGMEIDHRSDLFSLGVVLYELLTGRTPFARENDIATTQAIVSVKPDPVARYRSNVSDDLQRIVWKILEKDPAYRYQTAAGVVSDLKQERRALDSGKSSVASSVAWRPPPKRKWTKILIPTSTLALIVLLVLVFKPWKFEVSPKQEAIAAENRLAIMYFDNLADPEDSRKLGEIATNLLITDLSESRYVQVVSSQRLYDILKLLGQEGSKKLDQDVSTQVATKAHAKWMLMGNILQLEPQIILTAQLVEVASGNVIASQRITGERNEKIFSLVDKLTVEIKGDLSLPTAALQEPDRQVIDISTQSADAYRHYLDGWDGFYKYSFVEAERSFLRAIEIDSTFAMAYYGLSLVRSVERVTQLEAITKAVKYLDRVTIREKHFILAQQASLQGDMETVFRELESIIAQYPDEKAAYFRLGRLYQGTNNAEQSIAMFLKVIEIDPLFKEAYNILSYEYSASGEFEKSLWAINKYIELAPDEPNPYDSRGDLYAYDGKPAEAIASYKKAIEVDSDFTTSVENLGNMYLFKRDYARAESLYQVLAAHPDKYTRATGRTALARIPLYQGRFQQALRMLDIGIETDRIELGEGRYLADKLGQRARIYAHFGEFQSAIAEAEKGRDIVEEVAPNYIYILLIKGYVPYLCARSGDFNRADALLDELEHYFEKSDSQQPGFYWLVRGTVALAKEDFDTAAMYYEKSVDFRPFFASRLDLARCYLGAGRLGDAVTMFEKAMQRYDDSRADIIGSHTVKAYYWLGMAYEESGWDDKAIKQYETFLGIWKDADPGIPEIEDTRQRLQRLKSES